MHSLPMLFCHRLRADVMAPGDGAAVPLTTSQLGFASGPGRLPWRSPPSPAAEQSDHFPGAGELSRGRRSGHGWLLVPVGFARRDGGHHFYFDQEVWPDQAGDHPEHEGRLMGDELAPDFDVGPDVLCAG